MSWRRLSISALAFACLSSLLLSSCTTTELSNRAAPTQSEAVRPATQPANIYPLQIRELVIPQADFDRYPDLADARVGRGLSQLLIKGLNETGRIELTAAADQLIQRLSQTWGPDSKGLKMHIPPDETSPPKGFQLAVKIFDIATCQPVYRLASTESQASCRSSVGVQLRLEAPSGQFVPGATHPLAPQGRYIHSDQLTLFGTPDVVFSESAMGLASAKAFQYALLQALERLDRQGW